MITHVEFIRPVPIKGDPAQRVKCERGGITAEWTRDGNSLWISWSRGEKPVFNGSCDPGATVSWANIVFALDDGKY